MTSIPHEPPALADEPRTGLSQVVVREMWASLAITVMWVAVLLDAMFGPDFVSTTPGGTSTTIPSAVPLALFAFCGTWVVAKHGLGDRSRG
jgi:hypothetical protein